MQMPPNPPAAIPDVEPMFDAETIPKVLSKSPCPRML